MSNLTNSWVFIAGVLILVGYILWVVFFPDMRWADIFGALGAPANTYLADSGPPGN